MVELPKLHSGKALSEVKGLAWRQEDGTIVANENRALVEDIRTYVSARDVLARNLDKIHRVMLSGSVVVRGDANAQHHNLLQDSEGKLWRCRSAESLVDEMEDRTPIREALFRVYRRPVHGGWEKGT